MTSKTFITHFFITVFAAILFIPFLGSVHLFDWDEINFAECAREMVLTGDYSRVQLNFQPFWEKPPLFIWLQAISMNIFGVNEFAARLPNAICGILTLNVLYALGRKLYNHKFALIWVLAYAGSFLPHFYFKAGIIDPWFNLFIFLSVYYAMRSTKNNEVSSTWKLSALSGMFIGLAVLTKGPAGLLILLLTGSVFWAFSRFRKITEFKNLLAFSISFLVTGLSWFIIESINGRSEIVMEFITYQIRLFNTHDSGHEGFLLYHFVLLLIGCFPASVFFILSHKRSASDSELQKHTKKWMMCLFWVVLIIFTIAQTKIVHYSSMCYFPLSFLAAYAIYKITISEYSWKGWMLGLSIAITLLIGILLTLVPLIEVYKEKIISWNIIGDPFAIENLKTNVNWDGWEWMIGVTFIVLTLVLLYRVHKSKRTNLLPYLFIPSLIAVNITTIVVAPKVEQYSQGAAIEFYQALKGKDCYLETIGFKSYAYLFYSEKTPDKNTQAMLQYVENRKTANPDHSMAFSFNTESMNWMVSDKIDKPAFFVAKFSKDLPELYSHNPSLIELYRKNGFIFIYRKAEK